MPSEGVRVTLAVNTPGTTPTPMLLPVLDFAPKILSLAVAPPLLPLPSLSLPPLPLLLLPYPPASPMMTLPDPSASFVSPPHDCPTSFIRNAGLPLMNTVGAPCFATHVLVPQQAA